ncbi:hypothetical protein, partial [Ruthenibacterium lactatiformans]|uniref:hypothetical protein n=1 Tax=Ruthenibacterium lactatiformans TaxID=1550024 RepID=UPI003AB484E8
LYWLRGIMGISEALYLPALSLLFSYLYFHDCIRQAFRRSFQPDGACLARVLYDRHCFFSECCSFALPPVSFRHQSTAIFSANRK